MPLAAMASVISRIFCSFTSQVNLFQLFQSMGSVWAGCANFWARVPAALSSASRSKNKVFVAVAGKL